ncbi:MAG TPA: outer membrane lipoprotein-sorting protein [Rectinemataceae bacterium]|nr:outer membrane lipoprotein-sorting protein [Rectinemataceae bacterium]
MKHGLEGRAFAKAIAILVAFVAAGGGAVAAQTIDPNAAMRAADLTMYPASFSMIASISTLHRGADATTMEIEVEHKAGRGTFMEMLSPPRSKGMRFLQTEGALWMYSPRSGSRSPIRLSPRESFQGSVFSNNDVGDSTWANDYTASLAGSTTIDSPDFGKVDVWIVAGTAKRWDVPYGSVRLYLRKDGLLPLRVEYDAKSGLHIKTMELSGYSSIAGRLRPSRLVMTATDGTGDSSTVVIRDLKAREDLPDAMFNQSWLVR